MTRLKSFLLAALLMAGVFSSAQANVVSGRLWRVADAIAGNAIPANVPATTADVTFDVNSPLNFNAGLTPSIGSFLASGGAYNVVENTLGALAAQLSDGITGALIEFTGFVTVTTGQVFTATHDDGLTLEIGGLTVIGVPGPTAPTVSTFTYGGPSGTFAFQLVYGECCSGAAVLQLDLPLSNTAVPEPATLALVGSALAGLGWNRRRRLLA